MEKKPTMVIFWGDTRQPLTHKEMQDLEFNATVVSVTPRAIVLEYRKGVDRRVVIYGTTDPAAPAPPAPRGEE